MLGFLVVFNLWMIIIDLIMLCLIYSASKRLSYEHILLYLYVAIYRTILIINTIGGIVIILIRLNNRSIYKYSALNR